MISSKSKIQTQSTEITRQAFMIETLKSAKQYDDEEIKRLKKQLENETAATLEQWNRNHQLDQTIGRLQNQINATNQSHEMQKQDNQESYSQLHKMQQEAEKHGIMMDTIQNQNQQLTSKNNLLQQQLLAINEQVDQQNHKRKMEVLHLQNMVHQLNLQNSSLNEELNNQIAKHQRGQQQANARNNELISKCKQAQEQKADMQNQLETSRRMIKNEQAVYHQNVELEKQKYGEYIKSFQKQITDL